MAYNVAKTPQLAVEEALEQLLTSDTWSEYYIKNRLDPERLGEVAGRFRSAMVGLGYTYPEAEVRDALLARAGLTLPTGTPAKAPDLAAEVAPMGSAGEPPTTVPDPIPEAAPEPAMEIPATELVPAAETAPRGSAGHAASRALYRLYEHGCRLELRNGRLHAGRDAGLTDAQRELLREHEDGLTHLIYDEATGAAFSPAMRYVSDALRRRGCANLSPDARRAATLLNAAQDAYERHDNGLCGYRLRQAALAAAGRLPEGTG